MVRSHQFTLAGCGAICLFSSVVALIRNVTEQLGPVGGAAMIYSVSAFILMLTVGLPKLSSFSRKYLLIGGLLFVSYEMCLALSLGMANDRLQAVEMGLINYLWPCLTVLIAVLFSRRSVSWLLYPSLLLSFFGVAWTVAGDSGLSWSGILENVQSNPLSYTLALSGALIWAVYCNVTRVMADGINAITWFFSATAVALWLKYLFVNEPPMAFDLPVIRDLLLAGLAMGGGYALWNLGILRGNMVLLATLSYFVPVFSTFLSAQLLGLTLTATFWQGVVMVTIASVLCWWITREKTESVPVQEEQV
ncbi:aromatic amino acid DMT transporter YddG [Photobacterium sp. TLY01]|uniref:aromatic amino acid DMT transporter YddG n=1 Tax=Photobacterium sp. TLY01 TaxID=2907534 RepID=UPI001F18A133|nr:aromatic amino acid DMT transporter YddG [Photobacterium sp. TLY01]UIP29886.1 aromatic amino acid DMT transporter YddG [Photobacterium sp. TLY01]